MPHAAADRVDAVRRFNRFYTRQIGLLQDGVVETPFSLTEARVLYELGRHERCTASDIAGELGLDHGYLSRILRRFAEAGLLTRERAADDARQSFISLTAKGRRAFVQLDRGSHDLVATMLGRISPEQQQRVVAAMGEIEKAISGGSGGRRDYILRPHRPGDMGWVVARHGVLYGQEYGWDHRIESLTADIVSAFLKNFDPERERCWIAEIDGEPVGSVFIVREPDAEDVARLRLLLVEPSARGLGIGKRLVDECVRFAREAGYRKITLWTHGVLTAARAIYRQAGFRLVKQWVHDEFGKPEPSETWDLEL
jgi:DNA-binding MarR family transcriptional regulator/GNAT superfamily N-acetyltransferase